MRKCFDGVRGLDARRGRLGREWGSLTRARGAATRAGTARASSRGASPRSRAASGAPRVGPAFEPAARPASWDCGRRREGPGPVRAEAAAAPDEDRRERVRR